MQPVLQEFDAPCRPSLFLYPSIQGVIMEKTGVERLASNLWEQAERNPIGALIAASMVMNAATKLLNAHAWSREVARRTRSAK
jgi:hypothetical protein